MLSVGQGRAPSGPGRLPEGLAALAFGRGAPQRLWPDALWGQAGRSRGASGGSGHGVGARGCAASVGRGQPMGATRGVGRRRRGVGLAGLASSGTRGRDGEWCGAPGSQVAGRASLTRGGGRACARLRWAFGDHGFTLDPRRGLAAGLGARAGLGAGMLSGGQEMAVPRTLARLRRAFGDQARLPAVRATGRRSARPKDPAEPCPTVNTALPGPALAPSPRRSLSPGVQGGTGGAPGRVPRSKRLARPGKGGGSRVPVSSDRRTSPRATARPGAPVRPPGCCCLRVKRAGTVKPWSPKADRRRAQSRAGAVQRSSSRNEIATIFVPGTGAVPRRAGL